MPGSSPSLLRAEALALAALDRAPEGFCVAFTDSDHPWQTAHPVLCSDKRLRDVLGVSEPDPRQALGETVQWLWDNRKHLAAD